MSKHTQSNLDLLHQDETRGVQGFLCCPPTQKRRLSPSATDAKGYPLRLEETQGANKVSDDLG